MGKHYMTKSPFDFRFTLASLYLGGLGFFIVMFQYLKPNRIGVYRSGEEHGSARFATFADMKRFEDQDEYSNMLFTQNAKMGLFNKRLPFKVQINKNALVIGGNRGLENTVFCKAQYLTR